MKSLISFLFINLCLLTPANSADLLGDLLRNAAIKNGYLDPKKVNTSFDLNKSLIGSQLFKAEFMSFNGNTSCQSCHLDEFSSADGLPNAIGVGGQGKGQDRINSGGLIVPRNTLPLWGRGGLGFNTFFWDGKVEKIEGRVASQFGELAPSNDALLTAVHLPFVEIREMVLDDPDFDKNYKTETVKSAYEVYDILVSRIKKLPLGEELASAYGKGLDEIKFFDVADAITHHIKNKFRLKKSKFSEFMAKKSDLDDAQINGGLIFYGKGRCASCHSGPHFSDLKFHNIVLPQLGFGKNGFGIDYGRFNVTKNHHDLYKFRTPPLANVTQTQPYGHSGSLSSLTDVIVSHYDPLRHFDTQGLDQIRRRELFVRIQSTAQQPTPSYLDPKEVKDIEQFLHTLSFLEQR